MGFTTGWPLTGPADSAAGDLGAASLLVHTGAAIFERHRRRRETHTSVAFARD